MAARTRPRSGRRELRREPAGGDAREDAHQRRREDHVAPAPGEAALRHHRDDDHPGERRPRQREHRRVAAPVGERNDTSASTRIGSSTASAARAKTVMPGLDARAALPSGEVCAISLDSSALPEPSRSSPSQIAGAAATSSTTAALQRHSPAVARPARHDEQVEPVEPGEQPDLRAQQSRRRAERERLQPPAVEVLLDRRERERDQQRLGIAAQPGDEEVGAEAEPEGRDEARRATGEARREPVAQRHRRERRRAREHEPDRGGERAEPGERRDQDDGQRLPRRAAERVEVEPGELTPPDEPRPRVVPQARAHGEAEHSEHEARGDHDEQARAPGLAGWEAGRVHACAA